MTDGEGRSTNPPTSQSDKERIVAVVKKILGPYMDQQSEGFDRVATLLTVTKLIFEPGALPALTIVERRKSRRTFFAPQSC